MPAHEPAAQTPDPFVVVPAAAHDLPQIPQFLGELVRSTQLPEPGPASVAEVAPASAVAHGVSPAAHAATQPVGAHNPVGAAHWILHAVHVAGLLRSASQPLAGLVSQSAHPGSHAATVHPCAPQAGPAWAKAHAWHEGAPHP